MTGIMATISLLDAWRLGQEAAGEFFTCENFVDIFNPACDVLHELARALGVGVGFNPANSALAYDAMMGAAACFCRLKEARETLGAKSDGGAASWLDLVGMARG